MYIAYVHKRLTFLQMPKISESQVEEMDNILEQMMEMRLKLTKIVQDWSDNKYDPPITFKEHFLYRARLLPFQRIQLLHVLQCSELVEAHRAEW